MDGDSHPTARTRRRFLSGVTAVLAGAASAGCGDRSESGETPSPSPDPTTEATPTTESVATTETARADEAGDDDDEAGLEYDLDRPAAAFEQMLMDRFVAVRSIEVVDDRVQLRYVAQSDRGHEVAAGIETVVVSFIQVYHHDWNVAAVDATVIDRHDTETVMGRWRLEARWVESTLDGEWSRTDLLRRTLNTYHGDLRQGDGHHHGGEGDHSHEDERSDHTHEEDSQEEGTDHTHDDDTSGHSHGTETGDHSHGSIGVGDAG